MTSPFLFLQNSLKLKHLDNDQVEVTVTLPSDLFLHYIWLLDSLTGFVRTLNTRTKNAKAFSGPRELSKESKQALTQYYKRIAELFDTYSAQGHDRTTTVKLIGRKLRSERHPWCSPGLVRMSLVKVGRGGEPGRPRKQS